MRIHLLAVLACCALSVSAATASERFYDATGRYMGREEDSGRRYDASGRYMGREDANGRRYDASGRYQGKSVKNR